MDKSRTDSLGMWRYGKEFFETAYAVKERALKRPFVPYYFLMGHSIELLLKSFLMLDGCSEVGLKKFGHNLDYLFDEAMKRGLPELLSVTLADKAVIELMNKEYATHRFRYIRTGMMTLPEIGSLEGLVFRLVNELEQPIANSVKSVSRQGG
ncbi:hypothetical protein [Thalassospira lucentensis]|uniref:HEPN domain-containing protein n=1 Tax=Thalassospira lucentensis TaxID=168935 RepID=A0A358HZ37_9PROT|nr:hypothetical protein [Thalassospira lucentensis]HBV00456.1 hypothetical protein [Thalassospira lucentensis]HCW69044.1 hypothetical protein [Thalassospira lucentensis]